MDDLLSNVERMKGEPKSKRYWSSTDVFHAVVLHRYEPKCWNTLHNF